MGLALGIILGLIILVALVVIHELGHGIVARRNGVKVEELGIGFPPLAWGKKLKRSFLGKDVQFSLNWLPIGGFVRLKGEYDSSTEKGGYGAASYWVKTKILLAGVVMNWIIAALLLTVLAWTGMPKILDNQYSVAADTKITTEGSTSVVATQVVDGSPADKAGMQVDDALRTVAGEKVTSGGQLVEITQRHAGEKVDVHFSRDGTTHAKSVVLNKGGDSGYLGVGASGGVRETIHATWSAPIVGVVSTVQLTSETLRGLAGMVGDVFSGAFHSFSSDEATREQASQSLESAGNSVTGPIGILGVIFPEAGKSGLTSVVFLSAIISLSLAVMNTLPIPGLDGGRWFTMTLFRLCKKKLTRSREESIQAAGMLVLFGLIIIVTILDIGRVL